MLVGEIKIDASGVLGCPEVDCTLWAIEFSPARLAREWGRMSTTA